MQGNTKIGRLAEADAGLERLKRLEEQLTAAPATN
jgi:hypothetical protein